MSNVEKLKKKAAEFEQKKQFDRALEVYLQIIGQTEGQEDGDVTVYNRVGDLYLRLNKTDQAVNYYEQAVDLYTEGGYLNNAIALCNKILRHAPSRHQIYYKLGKISAKKGFNSDAKKNFLEYADRMHRAGRDTDAFKALQSRRSRSIWLRGEGPGDHASERCRGHRTGGRAYRGQIENDDAPRE